MKKLKKIIFPALLLIIANSLSSCGSIGEAPLDEIDDNYRTMYQIFPISYADSNGDGKGDIQGIIDKIDYIHDLNYTGLWLTPVHPSNSYHKYDVKDYKDIDEKLGTLADYDKLVEECHKRDMTIILDLVFNHSSSAHPWFKEACDARKKGLTNNKYYNYYNFQTISSSQSVPKGWHFVPGSSRLIYEGQFTSDMPDLNLQEVLNNENGDLANDLKDIMKFWLVDHDIDGFRLDAVTSYFTGSIDSNLKFLTWLNKTAKGLKKDCYIVGEASWDSNSGENKTYQQSGIDSFFMFGNANARGVVGNTVKQQTATYISTGIKNNESIAGDGIPAPFICNHDTGRMVGAVAGRSSINNAKFGHGVLQVLSGTTFTYYGDEIGMAVSSGGVNNDPNKRQPMDWGDDYTCDNPPGTISYEWEESYPYPSVKDQLEDPNSILNYVKKVNLLRRQFPQIARGDMEVVYTNEFNSIVVMKRTFNEKSIYVVVNASASNEGSVDLSFAGTKLSLVAEVAVDGNAKMKNNTIVIPAQGIAVVK